MANSQKWLVCLGLMCGIFAFDSVANAGHYGAYTYSASRGYGYRKYTYYHQPTHSYHYHMAIYRLHQPKYVYYYNIQTRMYWGRYNLTTGKYALLPNDKKTDDLAKLTDADFLAEGNLPKEGEGSDEDLLPPPDAPQSAPTPMPQPLPTAPPQRIIITGPIFVPSQSGGCHYR